MDFLTRLLPWLVTACSSMAPGLLNLALLKWWNPHWWRRPALRRVACWLPPAGAALILAWLVGMRYARPELDRLLATGVLILYLPQLTLVPVLFLTGLIHRADGWIDRLRPRRTRATDDDSPPDPSRRRFVQGVTAAMPVLASAACVTGLVEASRPARVKRLAVPCHGLPDDLVGYRLLHISDLHLAGYVTLACLDGILERARPLAPRMILLTGDIADNLRLLPGALERVIEFNAPEGTFAILGNHEHGNGIELVREMFAASAVPLLVDEGVRVPVGEAAICLGGIDDYNVCNNAVSRDEFYAGRVPAAMASRRNGDFRILLSHRPGAFDRARAEGIELTLSGHTHGGQVVLAGRSLIPRRTTGHYPIGVCSAGGSTLFTSRGAGHWFPLRLNCPAEAPVLELVRA